MNFSKSITRSSKVTSWITYDFANTIFSMNVVSLYFAPWVTIDLGKEDIWVSLPNSLSMMLVALTGPYLGEIADYFKKKSIFLRIMTLICVVFCSLLTIMSEISNSVNMTAICAMILFFIANYGYQSSLIFYNGFLPEIAEPHNIGKISGWGVSIGYLGAMIGIALVMPFNEGKIFGYEVGFIQGGGRNATFLPTAVLFLLFALPSLIVLKDLNIQISRGKKDYSYINYLKRIKDNFLKVKELRYAKRFLIAKFFYQDAIETVIIFMALYTQKVIGLSQDESSVFFFIVIPAAIIGAAISGYIVDIIGSKKTLVGTLICWIISLVLAIIINDKNQFYTVGVLAGISLGSTWTSGRPFFLTLIPKDRVSELFGFYSLSGRAAAIIGPLVWALIVLATAALGPVIKYKIAIFSLSLFILIGISIIIKIPENGYKAK